MHLLIYLDQKMHSSWVIDAKSLKRPWVSFWLILKGQQRIFLYQNIFTGQMATSEKIAQFLSSKIFFSSIQIFLQSRGRLLKKNSPVFEFPNIFIVKIWPGDWMIFFCSYKVCGFNSVYFLRILPFSESIQN